MTFWQLPAAYTLYNGLDLCTMFVFLIRLDKLYRRICIVAELRPHPVCCCAGDAHFARLQELAAARSPLLPQLKLAQYFRTSRGDLGLSTGGVVS
jgi:hypothetical protein